MDTVKFNSPVNFTRSDNGAFRAHATLPNGETVTFEQVKVFLAGLDVQKDIKRVTIRRKDDTTFDKWFILGRSFDLEVEPTGPKTAKVISATAHVAVDDLDEAARSGLDALASVPAKQGGTVAPAGGFAAAVAAASDPLVG